MKTILLDVDGVVIDCAAAVKTEAECILGRTLPPISDWDSFAFEESWGLNEAQTTYFYKTICNRDILPGTLKFYPGAVEAVHDLAKDWDVCFLTAEWKGMPSWIAVREKMLSQFGLDVIYTHAKHRVKGDFLVDDRISNLDNHPAESILVTRPWNRGAYREFPEVAHLRDVRKFLESL